MNDFTKYIKGLKTVFKMPEESDKMEFFCDYLDYEQLKYNIKKSYGYTYVNISDISLALKDRQETRDFIGLKDNLDNLLLISAQSGLPGNENNTLWPMIAEYFTA